MKRYKDLLRLATHLKKFAGVFWLSILYGVLNSFFGVGAATLGACITAFVLAGIRISFIWALAFLVLLILGKGLFSYLEMYNTHELAYLVLEDLRVNLYDALAKSAPRSLEKRRSGEINSIVMDDVESLEVFFAHTIGSYLVAILCSIVYCGLLWFIYPTLGWVTASLTLLIALAPYAFQAYSERIARGLREGMALVNAESVDLVQGLREVLQFASQEKMLGKVLQHTKDLNHLAIKEGRWKGLQTVVLGLLSSILLLVVIILGNRLVSQGNISASLFPVLLVLSGFVFGPMLSVSNTALHLMTVAASAKRIGELLDEGENIKNNVPQADCLLYPPLEIKQLRFTYGDRPVLENINLRLERGEHLAITGASGSGKSTLIRLLLRFLEPNSGEIRLAGRSYETLHEHTIRQAFAYVSQETYIFHGSLRDNLLLANPEATEVEMVTACKQALAHEFIMQLPNGYDAIVGERGLTLSGGEKQRLAIARALLKKSPILILDEAFSNLDMENEKQLLRRLRQVPDKTILSIAHRASTLHYADRLVELKNGQISQIKHAHLDKLDEK